MRKHLLAYVFVLLICGIGIVAVLKLGSRLQPGVPLQDQRTEQTTLVTESEGAEAASNDPATSLYENLRQRAHTAVLVSHASILVPFFLGTAFSLLLYRSLESSHIPFVAFALFMGIAMSVTAFPVLARIIEERGLTTSPLGTTAIACAAVDDVTAWCILAVVMATVKAQGAGGAVLTILLTLSFIGVMLFLIKPRAARILNIQEWNQARGKVLMALTTTFMAGPLLSLFAYWKRRAALRAVPIKPS